MLAVEGLVRTKHGRFGGNVVTLPGNESMANSVNQFVRGRKLPLRTLQETREALEPALARLAVAMSRLAAEHPGVSVEGNPVIAYTDGYAIADLRASGSHRLSDTAQATPFNARQ